MRLSFFSPRFFAHRLLPLLLLLATFAFACSSKGAKPNEPATSTAKQGLEAVPGDTLYLLSSNGPLHEDLAYALYQSFASPDAFLCQAESQLSFLRNVIIRGRQTTDYLLAFAPKLLSAAAASPDLDFSKVGLLPRPHFSFYSVGVAPVFRLQLGDPQKFEELLQRVEKDLPFPVTKKTLSGYSYRLLSQEVPDSANVTPNQVLVAIVGRDLVVAQLPFQYANESSFLPMVLGVDSSPASSTHANHLDQIATRLEGKDLQGFVSMDRLFLQAKNKLTEPSAQLVYLYFHASQSKAAQRCLKAMESYPVETEEQLTFALATSGDSSSLHLQLPLADSSRLALSESQRPAVSNSNDAFAALTKTSYSWGALNANLYQLLTSLSDVVDDEISLLATCGAAPFSYTPGSLRLLLTPMRSMVEQVDSLQFATSWATATEKPSAAFVIQSQNPALLYQGISTLAGAASSGTELPQATETTLPLSTSFSIPFASPLKAFRTDAELNLSFGSQYDPYWGLRRSASTPPKSASTLFSFTVVDPFRERNTSAKASVEVLLKPDARVNLSISSPLKKSNQTGRWEMLRENSKKRCANTH